MIDWTYANFTEDEFRCKGTDCCGGEALMDKEFMDMLQGMRASAYRKPMIISSGYRCPVHNERVSSTGRDGPHTTGKACDILVSRGSAFELVKMAYLWGFKGIGVQQKGPVDGRFIHLDTLTEGIRPCIWSY